MTERSHFKVGMLIWYLAIIIILLMNRDGNIDKNSEKAATSQWIDMEKASYRNDYERLPLTASKSQSHSLSLSKIHKN